MKPRRGMVSLAAGLWIAAAGCSTTPGSAVRPDSLHPAMERAVARVYPALVRIHVVSPYYDDGREKKAEQTGSGVIISPQGHVITNHHVAGQAKRVICTLANKEQVDAKLVGTDALTDLCVLQLDLGQPPANQPLPYATFGDSSKLHVGDRVLAMGCPMSLSQSVTEGIVSNLEMITPSLWWNFELTLDGEPVGLLVRWIGHDAAITAGNSGGPLVNLQGQVVGINEVAFGLGGAIPSNLARSVADQLIKDGCIHRSWTGLDLQPLIEAPQSDEGVLVGGVIEGSPAERAGVKPGDILLNYDGHPVTARFPEQIPAINRLMLETPVGKNVQLVLRRDGQQQTRELTTTLREQPITQDVELPEWGITASDLTTMAARQMQRDSTEGVLVGTVRPGGPVADAKPDIQPGDIIVDVAARPIRNMTDLKHVTAELIRGQSKPRRALVAYERKFERLLTVVRVGMPPPEPKPAEAVKAWFAGETQVLTRDLAAALNLRGKTGVRITQIYPGRNADQAGLKVGDIIVGFDGESIPAQNPEDVEVFPAMVRQRPLQEKVWLDVIRDGQPARIEVALEESPPPLRQMKEYKDESFEFTARQVGFLDRQSQKLQDKPGVVVSAVEPGGWAAVGHLAVGDFIQAVDSREVNDIDQFEEIMKQIAGQQQQRVVFFVRRGIHTMFLNLEPAWKPGEPPATSASTQPQKE